MSSIHHSHSPQLPFHHFRPQAKGSGLILSLPVTLLIGVPADERRSDRSFSNNTPGNNIQNKLPVTCLRRRAGPQLLTFCFLARAMLLFLLACDRLASAIDLRGNSEFFLKGGNVCIRKHRLFSDTILNLILRLDHQTTRIRK